MVSSNIANASTPGFGRRSLELAPSPFGGVRVSSIVRHSDPGLLASRRQADSGQAHSQTLATYHGAVEGLVGTATDAGSLSARLADFESDLVAAASLPGSDARLDQVARSAELLAGAINDAADGLSALRTKADNAIGEQVQRVNALLGQVKDLNVAIARQGGPRGDANALIDQRQVLIDELNQIIPVNVMARDHGHVALYTEGGAALLDGVVAELSFDPARDVLSHMTVDNGLLSGLEINGEPVPTSGPASVLGTGAMAANFQIRDAEALEAQADLDALARDLVERFQSATTDPTLGPGDAGLFTDNGAAFDPSLEAGLAGRLSVNALVSSAGAGETWRLRDGLGASLPGDTGDARQLNRLSDALSTKRVPASGGFSTGSMTAGDIAAAVMSRAGLNRINAEQAQGFASARQTELQRLELAQGVDTDAELQTLMVVEQAYAANARVIQAIDEMLDSLMRL